MMAACRAPQQIAERKCAKSLAKYEKQAYRWGCQLDTGTDTVRITTREIITHDTTIYVAIPAEAKHDTIKVVITNGVINSELSRLDVTYAWATAQVRDGILYLNVYQREALIAKTIKDAIQSNTKVEYKYVTKTVTEKTNYLTQWQIAQMWLGRLMIALVVLLIGFIVLKTLVKFK